MQSQSLVMAHAVWLRVGFRRTNELFRISLQMLALAAPRLAALSLLIL